MVKLISSLFFLVMAVNAQAELGAEPGKASFKMEFSKPEIFVGEQVLCSFNVYTPNELIEVEVAKFPEFRGYWNENLMLRQGPISTMFGMNSQPNSGTVGTYVLIPMMGQKKPTIEPMKIVLRTPSTRRVEGSTPPDFILSEPSPLTIKPLPPIPADLKAKPFFGAVGHFSLTTSANGVSFQAGEPTTVAFHLNGQGNFQDLNELPIEWPAPIKVVNRRSYLQGGAQVASKTFEFSIVNSLNRDLLIPASEFLYFNPDSGTYQSLAVPEVRLTASQQKGSVGEEKTEPLPDLALRNHWRRTPAPSNYSWISGLNFLFFALMGVGIAATLMRKPPRPPRAEEVELWRFYERMEQELLKQDARAILSAMESYVFSAIAFHLQIRAGLKSRRELLQLSKGKLRESQWSLADRIHQSATQLLYSPQSPDLPSLNELRQSVGAEFPPPRLKPKQMALLNQKAI